MKRYIKIFLLVCISVFLLATLCSCNVVEELKEQRIDCDDKTYQVLKYKGIEYKVLPNRYSRKIAFENSTRCYVAESDVPLLLIQDFGKTAYYENDKNIIRYEGNYYCTLDKHEYYTSVLEDGKLDCYRSYKYVIDEKSQHVVMEFFVVDEKTTELINNTIINVVGQEEKYYNYSDREFLYLDACDSKNLLVEREAVQLYWDKLNNKYGVIVNLGEAYITKEFHESGVKLIAELFAMADTDAAYAEAKGKTI